MKVKVLDFKDNKATKSIKADNLASEEFVMHVLNVQQKNKRKYTAKVKDMCEVSGTTKKPFSQKGTGNARAGTLRAVQHRGGRTCFGPVGFGRKRNLPKSFTPKALKSAFCGMTDKVFLTDIDYGTVLRKEFVSFLSANKFSNCLFIADDVKDSKFVVSIKNVRACRVISFNACDVHSVMKYDCIICSPKAFEKLELLIK